MEQIFTSREIEVFSAVMQHGTTTKAAEFLEVSQPGISKLLHRLEAKAGFPLFRRHRQRLEPAPEAFALHEEVKRQFLSLRNITRKAHDIRDLQSGRLHIGSLPALGTGLIPRIVEEFYRQHSAVSITLNIRATRTLVELSARGQLDLAIGVTLPIDTPAVVRRQLPPVPAVCVMNENNHLAKKDSVSLRDLSNNRLISLLPTDPLVVQLNECAAKKGLHLKVDIETNLATAAMSFVNEGSGVAVVDFLSATSSRPQNTVVRPLDEMVEIQYSIYRQRGEQESRMATEFINHLLTALHELISSATSPVLR